MRPLAGWQHAVVGGKAAREGREGGSIGRQRGRDIGSSCRMERGVEGEREHRITQMGREFFLSGGRVWRGTWGSKGSPAGIKVGITVVPNGWGSPAPVCPSPPMDATLGQTLRCRQWADTSTQHNTNNDNEIVLNPTSLIAHVKWRLIFFCIYIWYFKFKSTQWKGKLVAM